MFKRLPIPPPPNYMGNYIFDSSGTVG